MVWIPPGFAHGYYVTAEVAEVQYKCSDYYAPMHERCIQWDDQDLAIEWPLQGRPLLSHKDLHRATPLARAECFP
jgi:dTDP-4-dehydrorhamnose 3,5-epimerase